MSIKAEFKNGVFEPLQEVEEPTPGEVYQVFSESELRRLAAAGAGEGVAPGGDRGYPEGPCRVASLRASMRQCADAPPVVIVT